MKDIKLKASALAIGYSHPRSILSQGLNLDLFGGELVCLLGSNGVGKSTLMRTLCGLQPALEGTIEIMGSRLSDLSPQEQAKHVAIVLTERPQLGPFQAWDLVSLGRYPYTSGFGKLTTRDREVIEWAIQVTDIASFQEKNVNELSDGQRQRVMIARALAQEPQLLFLDEPTAFLDLPSRVEVMRLLRSLARSTQKAILMSTHDLDLALNVSDRIWILGTDHSFHMGSPEDLALNGVIEEAFCKKGLVFDHHRGTFRSCQEFLGGIVLRGEGLARFWTERALEREGFEITTEGQSLLSVDVLGEGVGWISTFHDKEQRHSSIYELITTIHHWKEGLPN